MVDATSSSRHAGDERGTSMAVAVPALPLPPAPGRMYVDFEERLDFGRLRQYRLDRAKAAMENAGLGALLVFDNNNIRYLTGVAIGEWTRDKLCRYALYTRTGELFLWDFGSAAVHHRLYCPWLKPEHCIASYTTMRGAAPPESGLVARAVTEIKGFLADTGAAGGPGGRAGGRRSGAPWPTPAGPASRWAWISPRYPCSSSCSGRASTSATASR